MSKLQQKHFIALTTRPQTLLLATRISNSEALYNYNQVKLLTYPPHVPIAIETN